jgi:uncharacterized membrane protein
VAVAALLATASVSNAGTFVPIVPVSGSSSTNIFGINDTNVIDGSYISSADGLEHGYFGPLDGSNYTLFDAPAGATEPRAISNDGTITGFANNDGTPQDFIPFERDMSGKIKTIVDKKKNPLNYIAQGMANSNDEFAGSYINKKLVVTGYLGLKAKYKKAVNLSISNTGVGPRGVDSAGDIVGWYYDANGAQNGFLISGGTATTIDYPDASSVLTVLEGINDQGEITGQWKDTSGITHAFTYDMTSGTFTSIDVPNATSFSQAWGLNNAGIVAVGSDQGYFIYCPKKKSCPGAGAEVKDVQIHVALKNMPHVPCVNGCVAPLKEDDMRAPAIVRNANAVRPSHTGQPQPMLP